MYQFLQSLSQTERDILSSAMVDVLMEYAEPVCPKLRNCLGEVEVQGNQLIMVTDEADAKKQTDYMYKAFEKHYGAAAWSESLLSKVIGLASARDVDYVYVRSNDLPSQPSQGVIMFKSPNGQFDLFDSPLAVDKCIEIELSSAQIGRFDSDSQMRVSGGRGKLEFRLSSEQYVRFMRSSSMEVPCTISSREHELFDAPTPEYHANHKIRQKLKANMKEFMSPLKAMESELIGMLDGKTFTSKKTMEPVIAKLEEFDALYRSLEEEAGEKKVSAAKEIVEEFRKDMQKQAQVELNRLPEKLRGQLYIPKL